ncbi:response regulator [Thermanaerosceptrum fracticalcis]|uniref:Stage 0 sporulation protein A homolog n=1 Tax=Thermanaerosceptrum fracticalcis TaxID=1712410 RepID=A0A7G6E4C5_THEFR|nr:response regulator transcription factor [Thermanaerosceptrum fracticalcis]QNB46929.1 response regulator [Thermanaerosceptrum fracticalcis]
MQEKIRVIIVDDHPLVREGLRKVLTLDDEIEVIDEAGDGQGAINLARRLRPDVVLMDINMPGTNGIEATRVIKREIPSTGIIALTIHEEEEYVLELVRAGVSGYVLKDIAPAKLLETIKTVAKGPSVIDPGITNKLFGELNRLSKRRKEKEEWETLTDREMDVLQLMSQGCSNKEIARSLTISEKTVKNHVTNIFRKLQVEDRTQAVLFAIKHRLVDLNS